jgi:hypothetical protein
MTYPLRVLSLGAGVQSTTLLLMMLHGEIEPADHVVFADTGWEPHDVYEHLEYLKGLMEDAGMPFHMVTAGNIREDFVGGDKHFASMPLHMMSDEGKKGMMRRQCTSEYKIAPLMKKQRELAGLAKGQRCKEHRITTIIGISWDEVQRMKDPAFSWIVNEYPLVDRRLTREDCLKWCEEHGYTRPPRSACVGCPYRTNEQWRMIRDKPAEWADAVEFDNFLRTNEDMIRRFRGKAYLHASTTPLSEVDFRTDEERGILSLFDQECEGMCGL